MPIMPSPTYHKQRYGLLFHRSSIWDMEDFEELIRKCNERGIKVIIDLVVNIPLQHPWFLSAKKSLGIDPVAEVCSYPELCRSTIHMSNIIISLRSKGWISLGDMPSGWYYEGQFWDKMPDLKPFQK